MSFKIDLGTKVKNKVSGFEGVVTGRCNYLTGCNTYCISPGVDVSGNHRDSKWHDEMVLDVIQKDFVVIEQGEKPGGGPNPPSK